MVEVTAVLITLVVIVFTLAVRRKDLPRPEPVSPVAHLEERKAAIYENLRDLQFEYRTGKLSDQDYQQTKLDLQRELAAVFAEIDRRQPGGRKAEAAVASPVTEPRPRGKGAVTEPRPLGSGVCPKCGAKLPKLMKFCGECGSPITGAAG